MFYRDAVVKLLELAVSLSKELIEQDKQFLKDNPKGPYAGTNEREIIKWLGIETNINDCLKAIRG